MIPASMVNTFEPIVVHYHSKAKSNNKDKNLALEEKYGVHGR
jgi:hypothetical protein